MIALLLLACSSAPAPFEPELESPVSISLTPASAVVRTEPDGGEPLQFEAWAEYAEGDPVKLDLVAWTLSNRSAGALDTTGLFTPSTTNGGAAVVTAELDGHIATSNLLVIYEEDINPDGVDVDLFEPDATETPGLWLYPPDKVVLPRNTPGIHFMWTPGQAVAWKLEFRSQTTAIDVYTDEPQFIADSSTWTRIAATNAGGTVTVDLFAATADAVYADATRELYVNRLDAFGSIIYWASTKSGLVEIPYGMPAQDFLTPAESGGRCVGCHAISPDGKLFAFTYDGGDGSLGLKSMEDGADILARGSGNNGNFHTFSPDGRFLLSNLQGNLTLYRAKTGEVLSQVWTGGDAAQPDWSPLNDRIVFMISDEHLSDVDIYGNCKLVTMDHDGQGGFTNLQTLLNGTEGYRVYYPAFSPDGEWIAFNRSTGNTYDDPDAEVYVMDADGGSLPIPLTNANAGAPNNSWPRWGPLPDDDVLWLAFASKRTYGFFDNGQPQIWLTAFDPKKARRGEDPSSPAHWLAGQDITTSNHIPVWTDL